MSLSIVFKEFQKSAIPDRLTLLNVQWVEGDEAIEALTSEAIAQVQNVTSYITAPAKRILDRYEFAAAGGWVAYGTTLDGQPGTVAYFKPKSPRQFEEFKGFGQPKKVKVIKYETPAKSEASPILPFVDSESAQKIFDRYGITPLEGETFWQSVKRSGRQIAVTEGLKKALALIAHGIPAIAIRGITQWHRKGETTPHPTIAQFGPRKFLIVFDRDSKPRTVRNVRQQAVKLGKALEAMKCQVSIAVWDGETYGKGIDDALFGLGDKAQTWLDVVVDDALGLEIFKRDDRINMLASMIARYNKLSFPVERETTGEYLPELPALEGGAIHVLSASMNAGKTTRIGSDWVEHVRSMEWLTLVLCPLNSLGQQTAQAWCLPHVHDYDTEQNSQQALWAQVSHAGGIVMCPDSLHRIPAWFWEKPVVMVLDEANQVIRHMTEGNTLGQRWADIMEQFTAAARHCADYGAIVLSEDGLPDRAVNFVRAVSGIETVRVFRHRKEGQPWDCSLFHGQPSSYRAQFLRVAQSGKRLLYVTSSQTEARRMERALCKVAPHLAVVRIDSQTNQSGEFTEFFEDPDRWLEDNQPDILILSPSAKSGVSIQGGVSVENAYFSEVWGYFSALATDTHSQLLGRFRPAVPRFVFVPDFIMSNGDEYLSNPIAIHDRQSKTIHGLGHIYGLSSLLEGEVTELQAKIEGAIAQYLALAKAVAGCQKQIAHLALRQQLTAAGHHCQSHQLAKDDETIALWKQIKEEIWREDAIALATATVAPGQHTPAWARKTLEGLETSEADRLVAQKVLLIEQFPGVNFDDAEICYRGVFHDRGSMKRGVLLQARAERLEASQELDRNAVEAIFKGKVRAWHKLPKGHVRSFLVSQSGVLELLDGNPYTNDDRRCQRVKDFCLRFANEIRHYLRLEVKDDQTPISICHKLLKKLGIERDKHDRPGCILMVGRIGQRGANQETFKVDLTVDPIRAQFLKAARSKVSESVTSICNKDIEYLQIDVTTHLEHTEAPTNPIRQGGWDAQAGGEMRLK
ncbi:DUF3854 domain-containing protein, partial [Alkalinema pantanalense CENA528]|uniref:DUF3854 domain-containing protein n=1 Tax=Alkalinema pantanalense TaxID=1620705 RepID=UPI003D6F3C77